MNKKQLFNVQDINGTVIYTNLEKDAQFPNMFSWPTGGHITVEQIKFEKWTIVAIK